MNIKMKMGRWYRRKSWAAGTAILVDTMDDRPSFTLYRKGQLIKRDYPLIADDIFATDWVDHSRFAINYRGLL